MEALEYLDPDGHWLSITPNYGSEQDMPPEKQKKYQKD